MVDELGRRGRKERLDVTAPRYSDDEHVEQLARAKIASLGDRPLWVNVVGSKPHPDSELRRSHSLYFVETRVVDAPSAAAAIDELVDVVRNGKDAGALREPESAGLVLLDVDGTISCGSPPERCTARPGLRLWLKTLRVLGYRIALWSGGGVDHAYQTAKKLGVDDLVSGFYDKPDAIGASVDDVVKIVGEVPALIVDDDEAEEVESVTFMFVESFAG